MRTSILWGLTAALGALLVAGGPLADSATAASPTGTLSVKWDTTNYSSTFSGPGVGGEFQINTLTDPSSALVLQPDATRRAGGAFFQTFCGQLHEDIFQFTTYNWTLDTAFSGGEALQPGTAALFQKFFDGTLAYNYTLGPARKASAKSLQLAIWKIQGQLAPATPYDNDYNADATAQAYVASVAGASGIGNVRVLVLTDAAGAPIQDVLAITPAPTGDSTGYTPGFWHNKNGQKLIDEGDLLALRNLNLVKENGSAFDPTTKAQVGDWINGTNATNMASKLSSMLAAMTLNVRNGFVNSGDLVYCSTLVDPSGKVSIAALMSAANTELGLHPVALTGSPFRAYQEALKNALDDACNNLNWV